MTELSREPTGGETLAISVVVPVYNERSTLEELASRVSRVLIEMGATGEVVFVDDGSNDGSIAVIRRLSLESPNIRFIRFRRNFGKSAALAAGFRAAQYPVVVTMDADLQDLPEALPLLVAKLEDGYDLVSGWRYQRRDSLNRRLGSRLYNFVTAVLTGVQIHDINCGFKCYRREVLDELMVYGEQHRYIPVLASYRGFTLGEVKIEHAERQFGKSRYGPGRVIGGMFSLLTVILLTRYTNKPLHFFGVMGILLGGAGAGIDLYLIIQRIVFDQWLSNRPILIIGTFLMIVGVQFILFGLLAEMIAFSYRRESDYSVVETSDQENFVSAAEPRLVRTAKGPDAQR
jgi:glycosyltransferase involved in cell wall biosynthesis